MEAGEENEEPKDSGGARSSRDGLRQEVAAEAEDEEARSEEGEDGRDPQRIRAPHRVSKEEREAHELTHTPYRAWCRHCVRARGRNAPHRTREEERKVGGVPKISLDYFFMSTVDEQAHQNPMLVMLDESTGEKYARAVGRKGLGGDKEMDWLIKDMSEELRDWGHPGGENGHIILKSDGENSIVAVRDALAKYHGGKVVPESPPRGESQSNGAVEEAGKTVREFVRVLKEQVEDNAKIKIECAEALTAWMIRWAAMVCSRYLVGKDGLTAYERRRGKRCKTPVVAFGEKVWYKELRVQKDRKDKFESEWREGIWLGHSRGSNETVVGTREGAVKAYAIKRQDEDHRWDSDLLKTLRGTPQQPDPNRPGIAIPIRINFDPPLETEPIPTADEEKRRQIRRMKITAHLLQKYGYTDGCDGCRYRRAGLGEHRNHTEACRTRIETKMEQDEDGRQKKEEDNERINHRIAEEMERMDQRQAAREDGDRDDEAMPDARAPLGEGVGMDGHAYPGGGDHDRGGDGGLGEQAPEPRAGSAGDSASDDPAERAQAPPQSSDADNESSDRARSTDESQTSKPRRSDRSRSRERGRSQAPPPVQAETPTPPCRGKREPDTEEEEQRVKRRKEDGPAEMQIGLVRELMQASVDIAEMYSPPRVTIEAKTFGLKAGEAMDLTTGWDFSTEEHKRKALRYIEEHKPKLIIGSPMCTMFSPLQRMTRWTEEKQRRWREDRRHLQFMAQVYRIQALQGRWFLHEHPATASSWSLREITDLLNIDGVGTVVGDQCMYGLKTWGRHGREVAYARKRTKFMSNSEEIRYELSQRCKGLHKHQSLVGGRAEESARYPKELCRAICRGLMRQIRYSCQNIKKLLDVDPTTAIEKQDSEAEEENWRGAWDDVTGEELDPKEVSKARAKEMAYIGEKNVWKVIPRVEAERNGWKVIQTRWIDVNKGDKENPNYRSRLVAKEFNDGTQHDGLFAATPPLEALRLLISATATISDGTDAEDKIIMVNDVARAFFEAPVRRTVCVELPAEAKGPDESTDTVGFLQMSLYGTRDAAANFQEEVRKTMVHLGFKQSRYNPSIYQHKARRLITLVHGDDFISSGSRPDARWFKSALEGRFEIKTKVIGTGVDESREERVLNRVLRVTEAGWEYEGDQRHAELIVRGMNLREAKGVKGPSEDEKPWEEEENDEQLTPKEAYAFRGLAARANYLAQDRADIQFAAKEVCRGMAQPTRGHLKKLRRLARYLIEAPRVVWKFKYQGACDHFQVYSDSDWAGCKRTARSTSGGAIMLGGHCIRTWSSTQKFVTLSSAEAELMAAVRASTEAVGIVQLASDWGMQATASICVDSSAALAVVSRKGNGRLRHVRVGHLWLQEKANSGELVYRKVRGELNPADLMTKSLPAHRVVSLSEELAQFSVSGHARVRLALSPVGICALPSGAKTEPGATSLSLCSLEAPPLEEARQRAAGVEQKLPSRRENSFASVANHSRSDAGVVDLGATRSPCEAPGRGGVFVDDVHHSRHCSGKQNRECNT